MKIGFIDLGIMGMPMCVNIAKKHADYVYCTDMNFDRAEETANEGNAAGGHVTALPDNLSVAEVSDVIITMVPKSEDSRSVYEELLPVLGTGKTCIDMSTIDPAVSVEIAEMVKATGARFADAPVVKSQAAAIAGVLGIYVGADEETYQQILPILSYMGEKIFHLGGNGSGLVMKICHNALVSQIQNGVNETMTLASRFGIAPGVFAEAVKAGGGQNAYLDGHQKMFEEDSYPAAFTVRNAAKDVHICLDMAERAGLPMPGEENAASVFDKAMEMGLDGEDWAATIKAYRRRSEELIVTR